MTVAYGKTAELADRAAIWWNRMTQAKRSQRFPDWGTATISWPFDLLPWEKRVLVVGAFDYAMRAAVVKMQADGLLP